MKTSDEPFVTSYKTQVVQQNQGQALQLTQGNNGGQVSFNKNAITG